MMNRSLCSVLAVIVLYICVAGCVLSPVGSKGSSGKSNQWGDLIEDKAVLPTGSTSDSPVSKLNTSVSLPAMADSDSIDSELPSVSFWSESVQSGSDFTNFIGMRMVWVDSGEFLMGREVSPQRMKIPVNGTWPVRKVKIRHGFWISQTEVTQKQYTALRASNPSHFKGDNLPVDSICWKEAVQFCELLTERQMALKVSDIETGENFVYNLPSEAQWEYSCRAGSTGIFYGKELAPLAWYAPNSKGRTHPVKGRQPNEWGLYDMLGNVDEWCLDLFEHTYYGAPDDERPRADVVTVMRTVRGGSYTSRYVKEISASSRRGAGPAYRYDCTGFRVVMTLDAGELR